MFFFLSQASCSLAKYSLSILSWAEIGLKLDGKRKKRCSFFWVSKTGSWETKEKAPKKVRPNGKLAMSRKENRGCSFWEISFGKTEKENTQTPEHLMRQLWRLRGPLYHRTTDRKESMRPQNCFLSSSPHTHNLREGRSWSLPHFPSCKTERGTLEYQHYLSL